MLNTIKVNLSRQEIIDAVKAMKKRDREAFLEELLATTSPEYLESIKEARADYKAGRVKTHRCSGIELSARIYPKSPQGH
jgi:hypothetical protein